MIDLYNRYRPKLFKEVVGQDDAINSLRAMLNRGGLPHAMLFTGPSGCGKTTLARICMEKMECNLDVDLVELNAANARGIDTIREIATRVRSSPMAGKARGYIIDEAHQLTGDAQNALLKVLEEPPAHGYIFLATTDPRKLLPTIKTRCTEINCREVTGKDLEEVVSRVVEAEKIKLGKETLDKIVEFANGSPRMALVLLNKVAGIDDEASQLEAITKGGDSAESFELARCLFDPRSSFGDAAKILRELKDEPETTRYIILGYANSVLLKSGGQMQARASVVIENFQFNYYDSKKAGLSLSVYRTFANLTRR